MADVFAMEDARNRRREEKSKQSKQEPSLDFPESGPPFPGSFYCPPGVYCNTTFDMTGNVK